MVLDDPSLQSLRIFANFHGCRTKGGNRDVGFKITQLGHGRSSSCPGLQTFDAYAAKLRPPPASTLCFAHTEVKSWQQLKNLIFTQGFKNFALHGSIYYVTDTSRCRDDGCYRCKWPAFPFRTRSTES